MLTVEPITLTAGPVGALAVEMLQFLAERWGFADAKPLALRQRVARALGFGALCSVGLWLACSWGGGSLGVIVGATLVGLAVLIVGWMLLT
jgi:hypothetical protein